jgi:iron complex outermembrane receptor protein
VLIRKNRLNPVALSVMAAVAVLASVQARAQDATSAVPDQSQAASTGQGKPAGKQTQLQQAQTDQAAAPGTQAATSTVQVPVVTVTGKTLPGQLPGAYAGGQVAKGARLGLFGETDIHDTPFNVTSYTAQTLQDQQTHNLADVVQNNPSVRMDDPGGSISDDFTIRGFIVASNDVALNGIYGIAPKWRVPTELLERVEVITGPTAMLTGATPEGSVGGGINVVTKRATDTPVTSITESYESDSQFETHVDIGRRFGDNDQFGIRVNGLYSNGNTNVDSQSDRRGAGSLALDYRGDRLRAPNRWMDFSTPAIPAAPSSSTSFSPDGYALERDSSLLAHVEYDLTDHTTVYASVGGQRRSGDELVADPYDALSSGDFTNSYYYRKAATTVDTAEVGVRSQFDTGSVHHNLAVTASTYSEKDWLGESTGASVTSNLYDVVSPPLPTTQVGDPSLLSKTTLESVGLADTLGIFENRLLMTLGARYQQVGVTNYNDPSTGNTASNTDKGAATPMAAVLYKLTPAVSVYANYIEGLNLGTVAPDGAKNAGEAFGPAKAKQYEVGAKWDLGRFSTTLSLYQITEPGGTLDPATNIYSVAGDERHRGLEWSIFGEVAHGVRLLGGASYTQGILTTTAGGVDEGDEAPGVPRYLANLGAEWDLPWLQGVTLTGRGIFTGPQYVDAGNTQKLASSTIFDIGARYRTSIAHRLVTLRAGVDNVFNRSYWAGVYSGGGYVYLSAPRTLRLSATVDF